MLAGCAFGVSCSAAKFTDKMLSITLAMISDVRVQSALLLVGQRSLILDIRESNFLSV